MSDNRKRWQTQQLNGSSKRKIILDAVDSNLFCFYNEVFFSKTWLINEQLILLYTEQMVQTQQTQFSFTCKCKGLVLHLQGGVTTLHSAFSYSRYPSRDLSSPSCQSYSIILPRFDFQKDIVLTQLSWLHCYCKATANVLLWPALL